MQQDIFNIGFNIVHAPKFSADPKKVNRSCSISVVAVSKSHGKFTEVKNFGVAKSNEEADELFQKARLWLRTHDGRQELDFDDRKGRELENRKRVVDNMDAVLINGTQLS